MTPLTIRAATPDDRNYLLDTTRGVLLKQSAYCHRLHPATVTILLEPVFATYKTIIASPTDDQTTILGFLVFNSAKEVAFVYVRNAFRRHGIASALLANAGIEKGEIQCPLMVTRDNFPKLAESKGYRLRFRPYIPLEISAGILIGREKA